MGESGVVIIGAGVAGMQLEFELRELGRNVVGFLDDCKAGDNILGTIDDLENILNKYSISEAYFAIPSLKDKSRLIRIRNTLMKHNIALKIVPSNFDVINGDAHVGYTQNLKIEDVLGRPPKKENIELSRAFIAGKTILVSGAAGSIGTELFNCLINLKAKKVIALDNNEYGIFKLWERHASCLNTEFVIADVQNKNRVAQVLKERKPEIIFHAAAYKHVYQMELNPSEAVDVNVFGTKNMIECAIENNTQNFVLISTDKAVNPTGIMGATKRISELIMQYYAEKQKNTNLTAVRFGNVIGSSGSVINIFKKQIESCGPVTVTSKEVCRYFMSIDEAVSLIISSLTLGKHGEIFVLDMGEPVNIHSLAEKMIELYGFIPHKDVPIRIIGLKEGEKLSEELVLHENDKRTVIDGLFITKDLGNFSDIINKVEKLRNEYDKDRIIGHMREILPNFNHSKNDKDN